MQRSRYAMEAGRDSASMSEKPISNARFFLLPESLGGMMPEAAFSWKQFRFVARRQDRGPVRANLLHEEYGFLTEVLPDDVREPVVIDAGANVGTFAMYILHLRRGAHVWCYEASRIDVPCPCTKSAAESGF